MDDSGIYANRNRRRGVVNTTNLSSFLSQAAPVVPLVQERINEETSSFFYLRELWESLDWVSGCGAEVPVTSVGESFIMTYAPTLSALQIYQKPALPGPLEPSKSAPGTAKPPPSRPTPALPVPPSDAPLSAPGSPRREAGSGAGIESGSPSQASDRLSSRSGVSSLPSSSVPSSPTTLFSTDASPPMGPASDPSSCACSTLGSASDSDTEAEAMKKGVAGGASAPASVLGGAASGSSGGGQSVLRPQKNPGEPRTVLLEYFESDRPHNRKPLSDRAAELLAEVPAPEGLGLAPGASLLDLRSCDIHPASWYAVLWTPIMRLPQGRDRQELRISFLTFHSIGAEGADGPANAAAAAAAACRPRAPPLPAPSQQALAARKAAVEREIGGPAVVLPAFGLAPSRPVSQGGLWCGRDAAAPGSGARAGGLAAADDSAALDDRLHAPMLLAAVDWARRRSGSLHADLKFFLEGPGGLGKYIAPLVPQVAPPATHAPQGAAGGVLVAPILGGGGGAVPAPAPAPTTPSPGGDNAGSGTVSVDE